MLSGTLATKFLVVFLLVVLIHQVLYRDFHKCTYLFKRFCVQRGESNQTMFK